MSQSGYMFLEQSDFLSNYVGSFQQLRADKELFDVTLACEDETIEAHKVVLAACSIFFRNLFRKAKQSNPIIYLKGVSHKDLVSLLDYIYTGQTQVLAEDVERFIQVGRDMQVKGLADDEEEEVIDDTKNQHNKGKTINDKIGEDFSDESYDSTGYDECENSVADETYLAENSETFLQIKNEKMEKETKNLDQLLSEISKKMEKTKDEKGLTMWKCKECGKTLKIKKNLEMHVEIHLKGYSHKCSHCGRVHTTRGSLQSHMSIVHRSTK